MKKNNILIFTLAIINLIATLLLTIFAMPNEIPIMFNLNEKVILLSTKWLTLFNCILPLIFAIIIIIVKNKKVQFTAKILLIWSIFWNVLYYIYYCLAENISIGSLSEVPISVSIFMPLAFICTILSIKLKTAPYKSKPAIRFKTTLENDFLWKQTHFYAKSVYFVLGLILFIISLIFCIFRYPLIELIVFILAIIIATLVVYIYSKSIYDKYIDMKTKQDMLKNKDSEKNANNGENDTKSIKKVRKKAKKAKKRAVPDGNFM